VKNGLFSTHPEMQERVNALAKIINGEKLASTAMVAPRYTQNVAYQAVPVADLIAQMTSNPQAAAPAASGPALLSRGLDAVSNPTAILGNRQDAGVAYARNVDVEQFAPGGPDPNLVMIALTAEDVAEFKRGVQG
jgi:hypothetical protein